MLYYIVPRIYGTTMYSNRLANVHFWLATLGILFYAIPMYVAGITQSLMWQDFTADGTLRYPNFLETVVRLAPMYALRAIGGTLFLTGGVIAVYNLYRTARQGALIPEEEVQAPPMRQPAGAHRRVVAPIARVAAGAVRGPDLRRGRHRRHRRVRARRRSSGRTSPASRRSSRIRRSRSRAATCISAKAASAAIRRWCGRCAPRPSGTATTRSRASSSTTTRSCGVRSERARISTASAASIRTPGTSCT